MALQRLVKYVPKLSLAVLKSSEMRLLWAFLLSVILLFALDYVLVSLASLIKPAIFLILGAFILGNNLKFIKSNEDAKATYGRLNEIIANLDDGIIAYDTDFKILLVNDAAERLFGINRGDVVNQHFGPERAREPQHKLLTQVLFPSLAPVVFKRSDGDNYPQIVDVSFNEPSLDLTITTIKTPLSSAEPSGFIKIVHDRTRELQLYKSKSEFITIAAHQLRTPLTAINWAMDILNKDISLNGENKEVIASAAAASHKALKIVNDLLDVAKMEEGLFGYEFEDLDVIKFLSQLLENANPLVKEYGLNLYFDKGTESSIILKADPNRLGLALSNVLDNAVKYNVKNGSITVKVKRLEDRPYIQISVIDTGMGVPPEAMPKLFTKFFRAENALKFRPEGSGFGLYITRNIINRHGGTVWVESTLGRSTGVYITLPTDPTLVPPREMIHEEY